MFVPAHPSRKNQNAARVGHPVGYGRFEVHSFPTHRKEHDGWGAQFYLARGSAKPVDDSIETEILRLRSE